MQRKGVTLGLLWMEGKERGDWNCSYSGFAVDTVSGKAALAIHAPDSQGSGKDFVDYCGMTVPVVHPKPVR
ncbi:hypothetical protein [Acaryochloris sp. CCMEE 5410]|uniref:hypothetical protein n=1 Tax=Acaryochloris sp. CCMEE 5410 TaxID=310037 RepID=UPI0021D34D29|nr:hypothetical protein [Acaryochloris sp. CCMEE 5410]